MSKDNVTGTKKSKDLALKNNNPGNLRVVGSDTEFQEFSTMQEGFNALIKQLDLYKTGKSDNTTGNETLGELMNIYAPKKDKNNPDAYAKVLSEKLGITVDTLIKDIDTNKLAVAISSVESPDAYNALIKTKDIDLGVDTDVDGNPILANPNQIVITEVEQDDGDYITSFIKPNGSKGSVTTKQPLEVVELHGDFLLKEQLNDKYYDVKVNESGSTASKSYTLKEFNNNKLNSLMDKSNTKDGLTNEEYNIAKNLHNIIQSDFDLEQKEAREKEGFFEDSYEKGVRNAAAIRMESNAYKNDFMRLIETPQARKRFDADVRAQEKKLNKAREDVSKGLITQEEYKKIQSLYSDWKTKSLKTEKKLQSFEKLAQKTSDLNKKIQTQSLTGYPINPRTKKRESGYVTANPESFNEVRQITESFQPAISEEEERKIELEKLKSSRSTGTTTTTTTTTTSAPDVSTGTAVDPNDMDFTQEKIDVTGKDYIDKTYLEEQLAEVNKQLDNVQKAEEFTPDLSMLDNRDRYGNLIAMASDLGVGYMGLKGAMEEIPEYEKGEMFKAYTDEAYRQRNMGYTPEEMGLRKQLAERGFGYDVKNIRRLTGGSAGVALGNLGRAAGTLQNRYAQIAAEDSAIRRLNQQRFDRAASADETLNRRKFEDDFKVAMMNKEMGAQLVRDKMTDMRERQQFQQQYGKGSVYDAMSREMLKSQQYNVHALKMAEQYQKDKQQDFLKQRQADIQSKLNQANQ